jgi:hypothetical protein
MRPSNSQETAEGVPLGRYSKHGAHPTCDDTSPTRIYIPIVGEKDGSLEKSVPELVHVV